MNTREPALITGFLSAVLGLVVTLGIGHMTPGQAGAITAVVSAVFAAVAAALTRPIAPAAFTGLVAVLSDLATAYGLHFTAGQVGAVNAVVMSLLMLITRGHVTPTATLRASAAAPQAVAAP